MSLFEFYKHTTDVLPIDIIKTIQDVALKNVFQKISDLKCDNCCSDKFCVFVVDNNGKHYEKIINFKKDCEKKLSYVSVEDEGVTSDLLDDIIWPLNMNMESNVEFVCLSCGSHYMSCPECSFYDDMYIDDYCETSSFNDVNNGPVYFCKFIGYDGFCDLSEHDTCLQLKRKYYTATNTVLCDKSVIHPLTYKNISDELILKHKLDVDNILFNSFRVPVKHTIVDTFSQNIPYYVGDYNINYFNQYSNNTGKTSPFDAYGTGPDGGMCTYWKCVNCDNEYSISDK